MRGNPVKQRLAEGGHAFGTMVFEFFTPGIAQIVRAAGAEFVLYDMEHSGAGIDTIKVQMATCRGIGIVPLVRVPTTAVPFHRAFASTPEPWASWCRWSKARRRRARSSRRPAIRPLGGRGAAFGVAHDDYEPGPVPAKIAAAMARTLVIAQIETVRGAAAVDEIAAVDGVDVVWLGHFDLTNFMGIPGEFTHPKYLAGVASVVEAARAARQGGGLHADR